MPRPRGRAQARGQRRVSSWLEIPAGAVTLNSASILFASLTALELARRPFTIVRTHLEVLIRSDQLIADEFQIGAVGLAVVTEQAQAIGITAIPTPAIDADSDQWFVHQWLMNSLLFVSGVGVDGNDGYHYSIDSKAMRKVSDSDEVVVVAEGSAASQGMDIIIAGRILIKEA